MRAFQLALRVLAIALAAISLLHLGLGLKADGLLGIELPAAVQSNPGLSSQNRFFGVAYVIYAVILWAASNDLRRYAPLLKAALVVTMLGGFARLIPWAAFGAPPVLVIVLLATELLIPPAMLVWLSTLRREL